MQKYIECLEPKECKNFISRLIYYSFELLRLIMERGKWINAQGLKIFYICTFMWGTEIYILGTDSS